MTSQAAEVERALLALAPAERAAVIHAGLLSLDGDLAHTEQTDADQAWQDAIGNRLADVLAGSVELGAFEATRARFAARYPARVR